MDEQVRRERLYQGQVFVFSPSSASIAFCEFAQNMIQEAFGALDPPKAQFSLPVEDFVSLLAPLKSRFPHHPTSQQLLSELLAQSGCDLSQTYFDVPKLRVVTHGGYLTSGVAYPFHPHRDTWYSAPMCQLNWWLPIYCIESENSLALHTNYWSRAVINDSSEFNYFDWNRERKVAAQYVKSDARFQPHAQDSVDLEADVRIICEPGGIIVFSGAQLHSTVPNTSGLTRFSIDLRTVHLGDVEAGRGPPNVDSAPQGTALRDFMRATDRSRLPAALIARYEDKSVAQGREEDLIFKPQKTADVVSGYRSTAGLRKERGGR